MRVAATLALAALLVALLGGCYSPQLSTCAVTCGSGSPCPADLGCGSDGFCHAADDPSSCAVTLTVTTNQNGNGHVGSNPTGIDCSTFDPDPCQAVFALGTEIQLTANHAPNTFFGHWSGDACDGSQLPSCTLMLSMDMAVNASFH
jgi:hypothetical protein